MNRFVKTISTSFKYFLKNKIWTDSLQKHTVLFTWKVWSQPPTCTLFTKTLGTVLWLVISDRASWTLAPSSEDERSETEDPAKVSRLRDRASWTPAPSSEDERSETTLGTALWLVISDRASWTPAPSPEDERSETEDPAKVPRLCELS